MTVREGLEERLTRRRLGLLVILVVALLGAGIGTLVTGFDGPTDPPVVDVTPTTPTPTPPADGPTPTPPPGTTPPTDPTPTPPPATPPPATATPAPPGGDGGGGGAGAGGTSPVVLEAVGSSAIIQYSNLKPADAGTDSLVLRNAGSVPARLDVQDITVTDDENGIVSAEVPVDTAGNGGELSEHVMLAIEVTYPNGSTQHFYNTGSGARSLSDLAGVSGPATGRELDPGEQATVAFDWYVPSATGNVIQSDESSFTVDFRLRTT